jgi:predicted transcriptional regulator
MSKIDDLIKKYENEDPNAKSVFDEYAEKLELEYNIMKLREEKGLSQRQLAKLLNKPQSTITRIETGKTDPRLSTIFDIAKALGKKVKISFL